MRSAAAILACTLLLLTILPSWGGPGIPPPPPSGSCVTCTALSADAKYLAVGLLDFGAEASAGKANLVFVYRVKDGKQLWAFAGHKRSINQLAFTPDGKHLLSNGEDKIFRLWDLGTGKLARQFADKAEGMTLGCLSPDGKQLLRHVQSPVNYAGEFKHYDLGSGKLLRTVPLKMGVQSVGSLEKVALAMTLSEKGALALFRSESTAAVDPKQPRQGGAAFILTVMDLAKEKVVVSFDMRGFGGGGECLSADNKFVIFHRVKWETAPEPGKPDTKTFFLSFWSIAQQKEVRALPVSAKFEYPNWLAPTPDGKLLLDGDTAGRFYLWDIETGKQIWEIATERGCMTLLKGGKQFALVSGKMIDQKSDARTVRIFSLADGKLVRTATVNVPVR